MPFGLPDQCYADICAVLRRTPHLSRALIFGSRALGTHRPGSDVDLALFGAELTDDDVRRIRRALDELPYAYTYDLVIYDQLTNPAVKAHIDDLGVNFYQQAERTAETARSSKGWKSYKMEDVLEAIIDYRGKTPQKTSSGIPLITAKIVKNGFIQEPDEFIAEKDYDSWMVRGFPEVGDVVLTMEAPLGEVAQITNKRVALAQRIVTLRGKKDILNNGFLKYFLKSDIGQLRLKERETGTTVTGIKQSELRLVEIDCPPLQTQRRIAAILSALDDKIELNRQTNATLEAIAQAMFKEWFVDFRFPGSTDEMQESELGMIPKGWRVGKMGEIVEIKGGTTPSTKEEKYWNGEYYWATPKDLSNLKSPVLLTTERKITAEGVNQISSGILPQGTLLLSSRAPIGYLAISDIPVSINQGFIAINAKETSNLFVLHWLKANMETVISRANGSTFLEISKTNFREIELVIPDASSIQMFDNMVYPLFDQIKVNEQQSHTLAVIRDALLPKLMNGELDVRQRNYYRISEITAQSPRSC